MLHERVAVAVQFTEFGTASQGTQLAYEDGQSFGQGQSIAAARTRVT